MVLDLDALAVLALDLFMKARMTLFRGSAASTTSTRTVDMISTLPDSAYWSVAQLNHSEYAAPLSALMLYLSLRASQKSEDLTTWGKRWSRYSL
jgi:hypothetical protein